MTVRDMIKRFHNAMDSMNEAFWNDARSIALINRLKDNLAQEFHVNRVEQTYTFVSVANQSHYQVPSTFVANEYLSYYDSVYSEITIVNSPKDIYRFITDDTMAGLPIVGSIWGVSGRRELQLYPVFASDGITLTWNFYGWPPDVALDNDEPDLPLEWHPTIVEGMIDHQQAFDGIMSKIDAVQLWQTVHIPKLKRLDISIEMNTRRGSTGSLDDHFSQSHDIMLNAKFPGGDVQNI